MPAESQLKQKLRDTGTGGRGDVESIDASFTLSGYHSGKTFENSGASGAITISCPTATTLPVGFKFKVVANSDNDILFDPEDGSTISLGGATPGAGKYISADTLHDSFTVEKLTSTTWGVTSAVGTLGVEA